MHFSKFLIAAAAFCVAHATIQFDNTVFNNLTAGQPFEFTWSGAEGPVTIVLKNGDPMNLQTVTTVASGLSGTSYTWAVPASLPSDTYAFSITDGVTTNYSPQVQLIDGAPATSTAISASASGSSSTGSSAAASSTSSDSTATSTGTSATGTSTGSTSTGSKTTSTGSTSTGSQTSSATQAASSTSAPGSAAGIESPLAFVFLALAAFFTLN